MDEFTAQCMENADMYFIGIMEDLGYVDEGLFDRVFKRKIQTESNPEDINKKLLGNLHQLQGATHQYTAHVRSTGDRLDEVNRQLAQHNVMMLQHAR